MGFDVWRRDRSSHPSDPGSGVSLVVRARAWQSSGCVYVTRGSSENRGIVSVGGRTYLIGIAVLPGTTGRQNLLPPPGKRQYASGLKINALKKKQIFPEHFPASSVVHPCVYSVCRAFGTITLCWTIDLRVCGCRTRRLGHAEGDLCLHDKTEQHYQLGYQWALSHLTHPEVAAPSKDPIKGLKYYF